MITLATARQGGAVRDHREDYPVDRAARMGA